jgi:hypothetical protein
MSPNSVFLMALWAVACYFGSTGYKALAVPSMAIAVIGLLLSAPGSHEEFQRKISWSKPSYPAILLGVVAVVGVIGSGLVPSEESTAWLKVKPYFYLLLWLAASAVIVWRVAPGKTTTSEAP